MATTLPAATLPAMQTSMPNVMRRFIGVLNLAESVLALYCLVLAYGLAERLVVAQETAQPGSLASETVHWWGPDFAASLSTSLLIVGAASGVVGSVIQQCLGFASRAGHETLERGFVWWYLLSPLWSALLGAMVVAAFNAGLISIGDTTTSAAGVTILVTVGATAGMFTDTVLQKWRERMGLGDPKTPATTGATADSDGES